MDNNYDFKNIERKWQKRWDKEKLFEAQGLGKKHKKYILVEFPYPSGDGLHVGHCRSYTALDILARKNRMDGYNVLFPMGWDAFGLPTENYAIKTKKHPAEVTKSNTDTFRRQLKSIGFSFDWSREINTTDPEYYKWTQWIFLKLFEAGLAYQKKMPINWCPSCKIGLANEEVVEGKCERCGAEVEQREMEQWMLKITAYADKLLQGLEKVDYPQRVKEQQRNWIGRSEGSLLKFEILNLESETYIDVFTTRADTLGGATYVVLAPEHELISKLIAENLIENTGQVKKYIAEAKRQTEQVRQSEEREKTGVELKGLKTTNPVNGEALPVWVADYVLGSYGTGAIMAVPAHDERDWEFANKFDLPIKRVISGGDSLPYMGDGKLIDSGEFIGLTSWEARQIITEKVNGEMTVRYKLRDWVFSRQHYWGEPIPVIHCEKCGVVPVPEEDLPVELPKVEKYEPTDTGESPLANIKEWVEVSCPSCGGRGRRETDTMPNWAGSSWYYLRYLDPNNKKELAEEKLMKHWLPVDVYNGGMEHTTLHLLYSRFWHKFLFDQKIVPVDEPYAKRTSHGMVLGEGGIKMSKSRGNVINPDEVVEKYGADTLRVYEMFVGPFSSVVEWNTSSVNGIKRFFDRVYKLIFSLKIGTENNDDSLQLLMHKTIKRVTEGIDKFKFNTAVAALMEMLNELEKKKEINREELSVFVLLLSPFAPHLAEEMWAELGHNKSLVFEPWPEYDADLLAKAKVTIPVQVNGKVRGEIKIDPGVDQEEVAKLARELPNVIKHLDESEIKKTIFVAGKLINFVV